MTVIIAGLGNPGEEYEGTRHNTGRMMLHALVKSAGLEGAAGFSPDKKTKSLVATGEIGSGKKGAKKEKVILVAPETFMNNSGKAVAAFIIKGTGPVAPGSAAEKAKLKAAEKLIVIYDDFNLPLGSIRISWNRSSGGHNGLESVIKALRTEAFVRVRIGVAPEKANGTAKVPHGEKEIEKFILSRFKPAEEAELKKVFKRAADAIISIVTEGREKAMSIYNQN